MENEFKFEKPKDFEHERLLYTANDLKDVSKKNKLITRMRGEVIGACLMIERRLSDRITHMVVGKNKEKEALLKELILQKEFFTLMNKWKIFREITRISKGNKMTDKERKKMLTLTKDIIETRDRFAHGELIFIHKTPTLRFLF